MAKQSQMCEGIFGVPTKANHSTASAQFFFFFEHNPTQSGKKMVTGVQVITTSQVKSIGYRWQTISSCP